MATVARVVRVVRVSRIATVTSWLDQGSDEMRGWPGEGGQIGEGSEAWKGGQGKQGGRIARVASLARTAMLLFGKSNQDGDDGKGSGCGLKWVARVAIQCLIAKHFIK